jgi:hypothetical protein
MRNFQVFIQVCFRSWTGFAVLAIAGCSDQAMIFSKERTFDYRDGVSHDDSSRAPDLNVLSVTGSTAASCSLTSTSSTCQAVVLSVSPMVPLLRHSSRAPEYGGEIVVTFLSPVKNVTVSSRGALKCSGSNGVLVASDSIGRTLAPVSMRLEDPSDCGFDDVTFGTVAATAVDVLVSSITIRPPTPFVFEVPIDGQSSVEGRVTLQYTISVGVAPGLQMLCVPVDVERGSSVTCTMSGVGGAVLTNPRWSFDGPTLGNLVSRPISYPSSGTDPEAKTWSGIIVAPGMVTAFADVSGRAEKVEVSLTVRPRPWRANGLLSPRMNVTQLGQGTRPAFPLVASDLGMAYLNIELPRCSLPQCVFLTSGPNRGLGYYTSPPLQLKEYSVEINELALAPNSAWRNSFAASRANGRCSRAEVDALNLRELVAKHEGTDPDTQRDSHTRIFRDALDTAGVRLMETAVIGVYPTPSDLLAQVMSIAFRDASQIDVANSPRNPVRIVGCTLF